jgi:hypothetical protein
MYDAQAVAWDSTELRVKMASLEITSSLAKSHEFKGW